MAACSRRIVASGSAVSVKRAVRKMDDDRMESNGKSCEKMGLWSVSADRLARGMVFVADPELSGP